MSFDNPPILIVDDEEIVLLAISESLKTEGYDIVTTTDPKKGLELLRDKNFGVIISDHHMPGMTGLEFFDEANKIQPMASRILITGVLTLKVVVDAINKGEIFRFIAKPWIREELLATVKNAIHRYDLLAQNDKLQKDTEETNAKLREENEVLKKRVFELQSSGSNSNTTGFSPTAPTEIYQALEINLRLLHNVDAELANETRSIINLANDCARHAGLDEQSSEALRIAACLVSLGKVGVDKSKLQEFKDSPMELPKEDIEYFQNLPVYSQLYASVFEHNPDIAKTVRAAYERYDGRGYPDGLTGDATPSSAKILQAITYYVENAAKSTEGVVETMRKMSGKAFDPEALELFFDALKLHQENPLRKVL